MNRKWLMYILLLMSSLVVEGQPISTVAGNGIIGNTGDSGFAVNAKISLPIGGAFDKIGNYYFTTGSTIRKVDTLGIIYTIAGKGNGGDGGQAYDALLGNSQGVTVDSVGNIYIAETANNRIRKIDKSTGIISTVAGNSIAGFYGDNGLAINAKLNYPLDLCFDKNGNLYIADAGNNRVRKINTSGIITTVAGNGNVGYSGDGSLADTSAIGAVQGLCIDDTANIYIASEQNRLYKVAASTGIISTVAGNGVFGFSGDGGLATNAQLDPFKVTWDNYGNIYIADRADNRIRIVNTLGIIYTAAGTGIGGYNGDVGDADSAQLYKPAGVAIDNCGNLYIADAYNDRIRKVTFNPNCFPERVKEVNKLKDINIYPNPTKEQLTVASGSSVKDVMILNTIGQVLIAQKNYSNKAVVDVSALSTGIYFIKVVDRNGAETVKRFLKE